MQVLLTKDVRKLGHVGDVVDVKSGYARNYLYPQLMAIEPTPENLKGIEEAKKVAAHERAKRNQEFASLCERLKDFQLTIEAAANAEGTLYGSVGPAKIADSLRAQGFEVLSQHVQLDPPIRTLDTRQVTLEFTDEISTQIKVWVVREGEAKRDESGESEPSAES